MYTKFYTHEQDMSELSYINFIKSYTLSTYSLFSNVWQVNDAMYTGALGNNNDVKISTHRQEPESNVT